MTEKRQTSQFIIRILQHFATKLWNITNFVMLVQAVMKFLSRLVEIKFLSITQVVNLQRDNHSSVRSVFVIITSYLLKKYLQYTKQV
jgi:hypothetical protein